MKKEAILLAYQEANGQNMLSVPANVGALRTIYAVPLVAIFGGAVGLGFTVRRWRARGVARAAASAVAEKAAPVARRDEYDTRLDDELKDLDG